MRIISSSNKALPGATNTPVVATGQTQSASDVVFYGIVNGLEMQTFVPSQRLVESDLAAQFDVGRNSVREAFQRLAADGFVELSRHKGAAIRRLSVRDTLDILDVAERMTGLLARSATVGTHPGLVSSLKTCVKDIISADTRNDPAAFARARRGFYRTLLDMSGSRELQRLFPAIQLPIVLAQFRIPGLQKIRVRDYRAISTAVLAGRADEADAAGMAHVRHVREEIVRALGDSSAELMKS